jgi:curved DNA-binding protein CbpA
MADYYKVLGVSPSSSTNEIDKAFYKLTSKFSSNDTEDQYFKNFYRRILEAHNVLSNEERRSKYDKNYKSEEPKLDNKEVIKEDFEEPVIEYFKSNKKVLEVGGKIILSWKTSKADEVILTPFGKVTAICSKIIYYKDFEQDKLRFSLKVINNISGKEATNDILIEKAKHVPEFRENNSKEQIRTGNDSELESVATLKSNGQNKDNSSQSNIKKYGMPSGIGILLIAIILFGLGKSGFWESSSQTVIEESLPIKIKVEPPSLIALNWENIHQEKELLIQNLKRSSKPDDQRILEFIKGTQDILQGVNKSFYKDNNYNKLTSMLYSGSSSIHPDAAKFIETVDKNGFKITHSEGMPYLEENTTFIRSVVETNIHNQLALQYLDLYLEDIDRPCCEDGGLIISYDELVKRTYNWGEFLFEAHDSSFENIAVRKFGRYLYMVFKGIDNTPAFDYETGLFNSELLGKLEQYALKYPYSLAAIEFKEYIKLLKTEKFGKTNKLEDYVNAITEANFNLSSEKFFVRFRDPDFYSISNEEKIRRLIESENLRDFAKAGSFYANLIRRYYDNNSHTYIELNRLYNITGSKTEFSENIVRDVIMLDDRNFELITDFKYLGKEEDTITQLRAAHYTFNEEGLIEEVYGVDSDYTYKDFRESDFNYISEESKIRGLLKAEDNRDYSKIASFYAADMKRYWHAEDPTFYQINKMYQDAWTSSSFSQNNILKIEPLGHNTYDVNVRFTFRDNETNKLEERESFTRYIFNEKGLIVEIYSLKDKQF